MPKTVFTIGSGEKESDIFLFELGRDYCSYGFMDSSTQAFQAIGYISFDEFDAVNDLGGILDDLNASNSGRVVISSSCSRALMIPHKYFNSDYSLLDAIYDLPAARHLHDRIAEWQMVTIYAIPEEIYSLLRSRFPSSEFVHAYTSTLKMGNPVEGADQISIDFTTSYFRIMVKKGSHLQLAETYSYKTPLDVVYYLLKICYEFGLDQKNTYLVVSGLVDPDSALYKELHHYFLNLHLAPEPGFPLPEGDHPHYYFTSLYNLAACVL